MLLSARLSLLLCRLGMVWAGLVRDYFPRFPESPSLAEETPLSAVRLGPEPELASLNNPYNFVGREAQGP